MPKIKQFFEKHFGHFYKNTKCFQEIKIKNSFLFRGREF